MEVRHGSWFCRGTLGVYQNKGRFTNLEAHFLQGCLGLGTTSRNILNKQFSMWNVATSLALVVHAANDKFISFLLFLVAVGSSGIS